MDITSSLRAQHRLWVAFTTGVLGLAAVLTVVADVDPDLPVWLPTALAGAIGVGGLAGSEGIDRFFAASPPSSDGTALAELRTRLVLQAVLAESVVLGGTVVAFLLGPRWAVAVAAVAAATILLRVRPRPSRLRRFDAAWAHLGHDVSLCRAVGLSTRADPDVSDGAHPSA